ncbi:MAG: F0F1 ATP synthase subunit B [Thermoguttaceae bacterium]|jgi:F-type H+-transporting ATPase subunit b
MFIRIVVSLMIGLALLAFCAPALAEDAQQAAGKPAHSGETAAGQEEGNINPIPMSWQQVKGDLTIWTAVVFLVLMVILWKFAWGPLSEGLDKREQHIADQIAQANEANQKAKDLLAGYEKKLADSQDEVRAILEKGRRDAEQVGRAMLDKAKANAKVEGERMLKQIDAATAGAIKELADRSAALAVELAGKIVHARLNPKDHAKLIEQAVAGFAESKGGVSRN